jgi:hypothetical protein
MITVNELDSFDPGEFSAVSSTWTQVTEGLSATNRLLGGVAGQISSWEGDASHAARAALTLLVVNVVPAVTLLSSVGGDISGFVQAVDEARKQMRTNRAEALAAGCQVGEDGTVTPPPAPTPPPGLSVGHPDPSAPKPTPAQQAQQQKLSQQYSSACSAWDDLLAKVVRWEQAIGTALADATSADARTARGLAAYMTAASGFGGAVSGGATGTKSDDKAWDTFADFVDDAGHANDFGGAGAGVVIESFEGAVKRANKAWADFIDSVVGPEDLLKKLDGDDPTLSRVGQNTVRALSLSDLADNPFVKGLTKGLPKRFGVLAKVPFLGYAFTAFDLADSFIDGKGVGGYVEPVANLAMGTAAAEGMSTVLASQSLDFIPGVGEVIISGTVVVGVVYGADKLGKYLWHSRKDIAHLAEKAASDLYTYGNDANNALSSAEGTVRHLISSGVHAVEPWHWHIGL